MKTENKRKIDKVTHYPRCLLGLLGRYHASYGGKEVIDVNIRKWTDRLAAFENEVIKSEEKAMLPLRESAARAISTAVRTDSEIAGMIGESSRIIIPQNEQATPKDIRASRNARMKAAAKETSAHNENIASTEEIIRLNENIISMNVNLNEHIDELRNNCRICIDCYLIGVKSVMPDYKPDTEVWSDRALEIYVSPHKALDDAVRRLAYAMITADSEKREA